MPWSGLERGPGRVHLPCWTPGTMWAWCGTTFTLERLDGKKGQQLGPYQLTVYDGGEAVPRLVWGGDDLSDLPRPVPPHRIPDPTGMVGGGGSTPPGRTSRSTAPTTAGRVRNRDFFGGSLQGMEEKLDYLQQPGGAHPVLLPHL